MPMKYLFKMIVSWPKSMILCLKVMWENMDKECGRNNVACQLIFYAYIA